MARPKTFNEGQVLFQTMEVFWKQGYEATSMRDIEKASRLTAGSIYHEFGNKKKLFSRTLSFYINSIIETRIQNYLRDQADPLAGIKTFLVTTFKGVPKPFQQQSCLLVNTAAELGQQDAEIAKVINQGFLKIESALEHAIDQAKEQGQIGEDIDTALVAKSLSLLMPGLLIASKNEAKPKPLEAVIDFQLKQLMQ